MPDCTLHPPFPPLHPTSDAVRGGNSTSHVSPAGPTLTFSGHLDPSVLNAGFAGAFTAGSSTTILPHGSSYAGFFLELSAAKGINVAVLCLKEEAEDEAGKYMEMREGREVERRNSTVSWEAKIELREGRQEVRWEGFEKTYRGKKVDGSRIEPEKIRRWGILVRSFFGEVEGDFEFTATKVGMFQGKEEKGGSGFCHIL